MATHSSVLAWRIPGTGEPVGLPSMGSHRVGHNWSNLAAAAASKLLLVQWPHSVNPLCMYAPPSSFLFFFYSLHCFFFFYFTILCWFCHTSTWICHRHTRVPHPEPPSHLPPCTIPPGHPSAPAPSILYRPGLAIHFLYDISSSFLQLNHEKAAETLAIPAHGSYSQFWVKLGGLVPDLGSLGTGLYLVEEPTSCLLGSSTWMPPR